MTDSIFSDVINAIMPHVRHREVAGVLFQRCGVNASAVPATKLPTDAARTAVKGTVNQASIAAKSADDPVVLSKLARDARVTVRRIVAANQATAPEDQRYLLEWAISHNDYETLQAVARNMAVTVSIPILLAAQVGMPWGSLTRAMRKQVASDVARMCWNEHPQSRSYIVATLVADRYPSFTLEEALSSVSDSLSLLVKGMAGAKRIRQREALYIVTHQDEIAQSIRQGNVPVHPQCEIEGAAAFVLLSSNTPALWAAVAQSGPLTAPLLSALLAKDDSSVGVALMRRTDKPRFKPAQYRQLGSSLRGAQHGYITAFLKEHARHLSSEDILALLREGDLEAAVLWLSGEIGHKPQSGDVTALVRDPGSAFESYRTLSNRQAATSATNEEIVQRLRSHLHTILDKPWATELVDALGVAMVALITSDQTVAEWFTTKLEHSFGDDPRLWETAVGLFTKWDQGVSALIEASLMANGLLPSPGSAPAAPEPIGDEQLLLPLHH